MDKIKKTNMNIKKITIAMLISLISIGNILNSFKNTHLNIL